MTDDLTPWEEKERLEELEEELRARELPSPSDVVWDDGYNKNQIVDPASTLYPPTYDPGPSVKPDNKTG